MKKEKIENDIKNLKEVKNNEKFFLNCSLKELGFIKNLKDVVSQTNEYQKIDSKVINNSNENYIVLI